MSRARDSGPQQVSLNYCKNYGVLTLPQPWMQRTAAPDVLTTGAHPESS